MRRSGRWFFISAICRIFPHVAGVAEETRRAHPASMRLSSRLSVLRVDDSGFT